MTCWASGHGVSPSSPGLALVRQCLVRQCEAWLGPVCHGEGHRRWHGGLRLSLPSSRMDLVCSGLEWRGEAGLVRQGAVWRGLARADDLSTGGQGPLC